MKFFLCIFFLTVTATYAQQDTVLIQHWADGLAQQTDTIIFETPNNNSILYGTMPLPSTHNQIEVMGLCGMVLDKISKSDCQNHGEGVYYSDDKVNSITETDSSFIVDITVYDNCCYEFLCDVGVNESGTLNLIYHGYGTMYCACDCCFGMVYHFKKEYFDDDTVKVSGVMINGSEKTLKKVGSR